MGAIVPFGRPLAGKRLLLLLVPAAAGVALVALAWFSLYGGQVGQVDQVGQIGRAAGVTVIKGGKVSKPLAPGQVDIIDGDTVRIDGQPYRLVGFDTPENGLTARCQRERDLAARATLRLRQIVAKGGLQLERVPCACQPGTEGTPRCNYGRLCGVLTAAGRDVGATLIAEGLARRYVCGQASCPPRQGWC